MDAYCFALIEQEGRRVAAEIAEKKRLEDEYLTQQKAYLAEQRLIAEQLQADYVQAQTAPTPPTGDWWPVFVEAAAAYGQDPYELWRVALCESCNGCDQPDPNADNGVCKGMFQFMPSTWAGTPWGKQDIFDGRAQIFAAAWMWSQGRQGEWTCY